MTWCASTPSTTVSSLPLSDHKRFVRKHCRYNIQGLRKVVPQGLDAVCSDSVQRYFGLCRRYEVAYRKGVNVQDIYAVVKKYTSHRKVLDKTGIVERLLNEGVMTEADFAGLCSCSRCKPSQPHNCTQPRCPHHGITARTGRVLTDDDLPVMGYLKKHDDEDEGKERVVADEEDDDAGEASADDCGEVAIACTLASCRKWRDVDEE